MSNCRNPRWGRGERGARPLGREPGGRSGRPRGCGRRDRFGGPDFPCRRHEPRSRQALRGLRVEPADSWR